MRVLVIEDDADTAAYVVVEGLKQDGHVTDHVADGCDALVLDTGGDDYLTRNSERVVDHCCRQTASTGSLGTCNCCIAGSATSTGSAGHAGATAIAELTSNPDHSMKAGQPVSGRHVPGVSCCDLSNNRELSAVG
jgi:CheY-like chemotaxis protein